MKRTLRRCFFVVYAVGVFCTFTIRASAQLNENCTVSILNRTAQVRSDGTWRIDNVPTGFGPVRARATCVENGVTRTGESTAVIVTPNSATGFDSTIVLGPTTPIPVAVTLTATPATLTHVGETTQVTVVAAYASGTTKNVTAASTGTTYLSTNPNIATVSADALVTAVRSGTVLIRAENEGTAGLLTILVKLSGDTDGDGIPDDVELSQGLNPNDPTDALLDADHDGLSNRDEVSRGTDIRNPDTDGDGLSDGDEVNRYHTNPLLADTDGDGVRDGLEIATGSDPTNPASLNLARALSRIEVTPTAFAMTVNTIVGEASQQLKVTGFLIDGATIDLTSTLRGTNYTSSDLNICNFGSPDGRVFGANNGVCSVTVANSGFTVQSQGSVSTFSPRALSSVSIPGYANNVDVSGNFAYVAAGSTGLQVVNVTNRTSPVVVASVDTPGNANDVTVVGNLAFVADGNSGLQIVDISNPLAPRIAGSLDTPGDAWDVVVRNNRAYVADGANGLQIIDVTIPATPRLLGSIDPPGTQKGVDVDPVRQIALLASGTAGIHVVDISNPLNPVLVGGLPGGDARDVVLKGNFAFVADFSTGLVSLDVSVPSNPVLLSASSAQLRLQDIAIAGNFAVGADAISVGPIISISDPVSPNLRDFMNFLNLGFFNDSATGVSVDGSFVYMTAAVGVAENGATGESRLYVGQYLALEDKGGRPPTISITSPTNNATFIAGTSIPIRVDATDDVAVVGVSFLVNAQVVFTDTTIPYEFNLAIPAGVSTLTLGATAVDLGTNIGTAQNVVVNIVADPLTTASGKVVDSNGNAVAGATVLCLGLTSVSATDGTFSVPGVPTISGVVRCTASLLSGGMTLTGVSKSAAPVPGGITAIGQVELLGAGSRGRDFWLAIPSVTFQTKLGFPQIIIFSETTANYTIASSGLNVSGTFTPPNPAVTTLPVPTQGSQPFDLEISTNQVVENKGIHVTTDQDVTVLMVVNDIYLALPTSSLGTEYFAVAYQNDSLSVGNPAGNSEFAIVATQNNTNVTFTTTCQSLQVPAGSTVNLQLNEGQTYQYQCLSLGQDVTGTHIVSDRPVAVIAGNRAVVIPSGATTSGSSLTSEMMFPVASLYGTQFYSSPLPFFINLAQSPGTAVRILAAEDGTVVTVDGVPGTATFNLNRGQFQELQLPRALSPLGARYSSNKPISVTQYALSKSQAGFGGPFQLQLVPTTAWRTSFQFLSPFYFTNNPSLPGTFAIITAPNSAVASVKLNGAPVTGFQPLPGGTHQFVVLQVPGGLNVVGQPNVITAAEPIAVYSVGFGYIGASYGYPAGY